MKKKKEFFRIRKDRKRKNGANARACVRIHRQDSPRPFAAFQIREKRTNRRPRKAVDRFSSRPLFCFLNLPANRKARPSRSPYACACVCICTQTHPPPTSENSQERRVCPFQALQGTYKPFYGRDR